MKSWIEIFLFPIPCKLDLVLSTLTIIMFSNFRSPLDSRSLVHIFLPSFTFLKQLHNQFTNPPSFSHLRQFLPFRKKSPNDLNFRQARNDQHSTSRFSFSMVTMAFFRYPGFNLRPLPNFFLHVLRRRVIRKV